MNEFIFVMAVVSLMLFAKYTKITWDFKDHSIYDLIKDLNWKVSDHVEYCGRTTVYTLHSGQYKISYRDHYRKELSYVGVTLYHDDLEIKTYNTSQNNPILNVVKPIIKNHFKNDKKVA